MPYKIAIASGKGGTGKTTVAINLFSQLKKRFGVDIELVDCDVEEPNDVLFFQDAKLERQEEVTQLMPSINLDKCTFCKACTEYCEYNAIVVLPQKKYAEVNTSLCHSCGACLVACKHDAIEEGQQLIGAVNLYQSLAGDKVREGRLKVGSAMQTMLISNLKERVANNNSIVVYDAPPGTSCSVVETVGEVDYVVLVAEPTLFGLHDMKLMVTLLNDLKVPFGVVVNKAGMGDDSVDTYLQQESIEKLGEIPFSKEYAGKYAQGQILSDMPQVVESAYWGVMERLSQKIM